MNTARETAFIHSLMGWEGSSNERLRLNFLLFPRRRSSDRSKIRQKQVQICGSSDRSKIREKRAQICGSSALVISYHISNTLRAFECRGDSAPPFPAIFKLSSMQMNSMRRPLSRRGSIKPSRMRFGSERNIQVLSTMQRCAEIFAEAKRNHASLDWTLSSTAAPNSHSYLPTSAGIGIDSFNSRGAQSIDRPTNYRKHIFSSFFCYAARFP